MDKTIQNALQHLIKNQASTAEIALLITAAINGQVIIKGDVKDSVIVVGNNNTVVLPPAAWQRLQNDYVPPSLPDSNELAESSDFLPLSSRMPFYRNRAFTGRVDDLKQLAAGFQSNPQITVITQSIAVTGMGGIGKTQLAVEFCYRYGRFFHGVHWLNARDGNLDAEIAACGLAMGLPEFPKTTREQVATTLRAWQAQPMRLVVLDNLEDSHILSEWLPRLNGLRILITTRRQHWEVDLGVDVHRLNALPRADAVTLLFKLAPRLRDAFTTEIEVLAERLGDLPLALDLAGRYLYDCQTLTPGQFLTELDEAGKAISHTSLVDWTGHNPTKHETSLFATFWLSWKRISIIENPDIRHAQPKDIEHMFIACGYCAPNIPIPFEVFEAILDDSKIATLATRRLIELGLLGENQTIHILLAEFARTQETDRAILTLLVKKMVMLSYRALESGISTEFARLRRHLESIVPSAETANLVESGTILSNLGSHLCDLVEYTAAKQAYENALSIYEEHLAPDDPTIGGICCNLGTVFQDLGDFGNARAMYERALRIDEKHYGSVHPNVSIDLNNLGSLLKKTGDLVGAKELYERSLTIDELTLGKGHQNFALHSNNLGRVLQALGDWGGADSMLERALEIDEKNFGKEHLSVASDLHNIAFLSASMGDLSKAINVEKRALAIFRKLLPPEHPTIQNAYESLRKFENHVKDQ